MKAVYLAIESEMIVSQWVPDRQDKLVWRRSEVVRTMFPSPQPGPRSSIMIGRLAIVTAEPGK